MFLDDRKKRILQAIVDYYVNRAEPIASKIIAEEYGLDLSSATIRNEMAEMEEMGLLEKTHTSSGRVPSDLGYRYYVDDIMEPKDVKKDELEEIIERVESKHRDMLQAVSMALSGATHYTAISLDDDGMFLYGRNNVFDFPEFNDIESLKRFMCFLEEEQLIRDLISSVKSSDITITIGKENPIEMIQNYSLITFPYQDKGDIAIIGPKRMDYGKVIAYIRYLIDNS